MSIFYSYAFRLCVLQEEDGRGRGDLNEWKKASSLLILVPWGEGGGGALLEYIVYRSHTDHRSSGVMAEKSCTESHGNLLMF
jgi:hypothetical protein